MTKYTLDEFRDAVANSNNIRQVCLKLNISAYGGSYEYIKRKIKKYNIDTSHFNKKSTKRITCFSLPLDIILVKGSFYTNTSVLKNRLIANGILENKCYSCQRTKCEINGKMINMPLELHHIDGDRNNNEIENLTLLCPICHNLTTNFRGKKKVKKLYMYCKKCHKEIRQNKYELCKDCYVEENYPRETKVYPAFCSECGRELNKSKSGLCRSCINKKMTTLNKPSKEVLEKEIQENSFLALGRKYGVSDNAVRKWCKQYGIDFKHGIRKESLQGLKKGRETQAYQAKLKRICPKCGKKKSPDSELCRTCYLEEELKKKQATYLN